MSKFNESTENKNKTTNRSGVAAYKMGDKDKLISQILTSFFNEKKYYGDNSQEIIENIQGILNYDSKFIANLALFARKEMHMRTISHVLIGELARHNEGKPFVRKTLNRGIERVDDMLEILSYYISKYGKPIPNSLKKGLADSFATFNEYSLAKYNRAKEVKLKDILCLTHPSPSNNAQSELWKRVLEDKLKTPITWETELSLKGNTRKVWEDLILENRLGYMALLRNLKNIFQVDISERCKFKIYNTLMSEEAIVKNKQLPFRYFSAYRTLKEYGLGSSKIYDSLEYAIKISARNINQLKGKTLISADVSGSMRCKISERSEISCSEISTLLMAIANYICEETITTTFHTSLRVLNLPTTNGILSNMSSIPIDGGGTDISLPIRYLLERKIFVDRIIILSDNEINSSWATGGWGFYGRESVACQQLVEQYKREVNPNVWVHAIDLQGYGTQQFMGKNVNLISGWSERVLEFIDLAEKGEDSLKKRIEGYYFK